MKKRMLAGVLSIILCLAVGCSNEQSDIYENMGGTPELKDAASSITESETVATESKKLSGTLEIFYPTQFYPYIYLYTVSNFFLKENPDVNIKIVGPENFVNYREEFSIALASNSPGDLVDVSNYLDVYKGYSSGIFVDLYDYYNTDPDINKESYYSNILKALEYNGGLPALTPVFEFDTARINKGITDKLDIDLRDIEKISLKEIYEICSKAMETGVETNPIVTGWFWPMLKEVDSAFFGPYILNNSQFNQDEFKETLELYYNYNNTEYSSNSGSLYEDELRFIKNEIAKVFIPTVTSVNISRFYEESDTYTKIIPICQTNGAVPFKAEFRLAIPASADNKELAWEFIKFMISDIDFGEQMKLGLRTKGMFLNKETNRRQYVYGLGADKDEEYTRLDEIIGQLNTISCTSSDFQYGFMNAIQEYSEGKINLEDAVAACVSIGEKYSSE